MLYATDASGDQIFGFSIAADGSTTWLPGFPLHNQTGPRGLAVSPNSATLYAALSTGARPYAIDAAAGTLTAGTLAAAGTGPSAVALAPSGAQLYVANSGSNTISRYKVNADGSLPATASTTTDTGTINTTGTAPDGLAMTPDGRFLYAADGGTATISVFSVDATTGNLTELTTSPVSSPVGVGTSSSMPAGLTMAPSGAYLYAALKGDNAIAAWSIDPATGALTALSGSPYPAGTGPTGIAVSSDGTKLLAANAGDGTVARYLIATSGPTAGIPVRVPSTILNPDPPVTGAQSVTISLDGKHAYVGGSAGLAAFDLSVLGGMTTRGIVQPTGASHNAVALTPDQGPVARVNPVAAPATTPSRFQGGPSTDSDGTVTKWSWNFGDGTIGDGDTVTHSYANPGTYTVTLTVTDDEGCSATPVYTGQQLACVPSGLSTWSGTITVPPAPDNTPPDQTCAHDGNDGFCGTPDQKAPQATILGINDGASINDVDAPTVFGGSTTPDPSGIQAVKMRFSKAAGTVRGTKTVRKKVCRTRKVHGKKRRTCTRKKVTVRTNTKVPACLTVSGTHNYLVVYQCSKVPWVTITAANDQFRYDLPVALGLGTYTLQVIAIDGAGNSDVLEKGRNSLTFKVVKTPANTGTGAGDTSGGTTTGGTATPPPVNDTGSPF